MADTIWKYPLRVEPGKVIEVEMPVGSKIVYFAWQDHTPTIWVLAGSLRSVLVKRMFAIVGTGFDLPEDAEYVGTFMVREFVWHVIEKSRANKRTN